MTNEQLNKEAERLINEFQLKAHAMRITAIECVIIHCDEMVKYIEFFPNMGISIDHYQQLKQTLTNKLK